jgi:hypothetical protein
VIYLGNIVGIVASIHARHATQSKSLTTESFLQQLVASFLHSSATAVSIILCGADRVRVRWIVFCPERYQAAAAAAAHVTHVAGGLLQLAAAGGAAAASPPA